MNNDQQDQLNRIFDSKYPIISREREDGSLYTTVFITREIGAPEEFTELIAVMDAANDNDEILFKFTTPGGRLDSTIMFIDASENCKALLTGEVIGEVASAGTMWLMCMDDIKVARFGYMMIHNYSEGLFGKGGELKSEVTFGIPFKENFMKSVYKTFLTKKEIKAVIKDGDMYIGRDEILERWQRVQNKRSELLTKMEEQDAKEQLASIIEYVEAKGYTVTK